MCESTTTVKKQQLNDYAGGVIFRRGVSNQLIALTDELRPRPPPPREKAGVLVRIGAGRFDVQVERGLRLFPAPRQGLPPLIPIKGGMPADLYLQQPCLVPNPPKHEPPAATPRGNDDGFWARLNRCTERRRQPSGEDEVVTPQVQHVRYALEPKISRPAPDAFVPLIHQQAQTPVSG